ncbi:ABC-2 family transporter protein [Thermoactinomyces sp. DSM 45891]|uniref:YhgE/Pip domain-containing protein n=1 Tax=Thermoactinomyces sp. DSM 45891 TaxID=1761907 RepID=UPI00091715C4|nr:YhgE/Pip domain-containing protein [Thermoactinomyces sp. DSM 45891]SFX81571.1 ABC-2 family transporter protein [Thermoactinomyces sp. DSM 45891]
MISWYIAQAQWKRIWRNRLGRLAILAILFVPLLYCGLYLYAFWDPYGSLNQLPVALVNEDQGGIYKGERENLGNELVDEIKEKIEVNWHVVNRSEAKEGVEGDKYFLAIIIPSDFTERSLSITTSNPKKAKLNFIRNEGKNYVAGQIAMRIENELSTGIGKKFTQEYISNIFDLINESKEGLTKAADAAEKIADGTKKLSESSHRIQESITKASDGANKILSGTRTLQESAGQLEDGSREVNDGTKQLVDKVEQIGYRVQEIQRLFPLQAGKISQKFQDLQQDVEKIRTLADGTDRLYQGLIRFHKGTDDLESAISQLTKGLNELSQKIPEFVASMEKISESNQQLARKLSESSTGSEADSKLLAEIVSDPIDTEDKSTHQVGEYGVGLAPYFLPLSLWIGALMLFFVLPINEKRWKFGPYRLGLVPLGQFLSLYPIGIFQALLTGSIVHYGLGLPIELGVSYYLFLICISLMSITVIGFFIGTFGDGPGRLLAIVILVLQLVSSGGTFPTELIPGPLQKISGFLPMSHGVNGLRNIIALNRPEEMLRYFVAILGFLALALIGSILIQRRSFKWRDLKPRDRLEVG